MKTQPSLFLKLIKINNERSLENLNQNNQIKYLIIIKAQINFI